MRKTTSYYARKANKKAQFWIKTVGRYLRVRRKLPTGEVYATIKCMAQPLGADAVLKLVREGNLNAANSFPVRFIFDDRAHVVAGDDGPAELDEVEYRNFWHTLGKVVPAEINEQVIILSSIGLRNEKNTEAAEW